VLHIQTHIRPHCRRSGVAVVLSLLFLVGACILSKSALAQSDPKDVVVLANATVSASPPQIHLQWPYDATATGYTVYRKSLSSTDWGQPYATLGSTATSYTDGGVVIGTAYEYKILRNDGSYTATGFVASGIKLPLVEDRGKVILLVEKDVAATLTTELDRLKMDLVGDGWTIIRHDISSQAAVADVKNLVAADYNADPVHVKSLFIFGHVPIAKSGWMYPDGHSDNPRPFGTDQYYSAVGTVWTDTATHTRTDTKDIKNVPGDGIFDQNSIYEVTSDPAPIKLQFGRVDMFDLPAFSNVASERELLSNYLNKDHLYRMKSYDILQKGFVQDDFGTYGEYFAQNGWRFASFFGADNVSKGNWTSMVSNDPKAVDENGDPLNTTPYLWGYGCGGGSYTSCGTVITTDEMIDCDPAVFTMLFGSQFCNWEHENDLLRAELATSSYGLTCCWGARPNWFFHRMGIGEPIGESARQTINNDTVYGSYYAGIYEELLGDPTLRLTMVAPPNSPTIAREPKLGPHGVTLSWQASDDDTIAGYNVYQLVTANGPARRVNSTLITGTSLDIPNPLTGCIGTYLIRAVKLESSTSSSYYNASQGVSVSLTTPDLLPVANTDSYTAVQDTPLTVTASAGVLSNDTDADGDTLAASRINIPAHGTVTLNSDGSFTYTPYPGFVGQDSFTYKADDGYNQSKLGWVLINVITPPTATDDNYVAVKGKTLIVTAPGVLSNDTTTSDQPMTAVKLSDPTHGQVILNTDGSFNYTPDAGYAGTDSFSYKANDGYADSNSATVTLTIDEPPVVVTHSYTVSQGSVLGIAAPGLLAGASSVNGYTLSAKVATNPLHGTVVVNSNGAFTYTPTASYDGIDHFNYVANDGYADSTPATVTITVIGAPVVLPVAYTVNQNSTLTIDAPGLLTGYTDPNNRPITASKATDPAHGTVTVNADGSFVYTPTANYVGPDSFMFIGYDGLAYSAPTKVTITVNPTGYEGDVAPRGSGDGKVTMADWVQVARFVVGLDTLDSPSEFLRADCAPRASSGDGVLDILDVVQVGRYAAGLDALKPAGGPTQATGNAGRSAGAYKPAATTKRVLGLGMVTLRQGHTGTVPMTLTAQGDENSLGCTITFDPKRVKFAGAKLAGAPANAQLLINTNNAATGNVALMVLAPQAKAFAAGKRAVIQLTFTALANAAVGPAPITFSNTVTGTMVVSATATQLPVTLANGSIMIVK